MSFVNQQRPQPNLRPCYTASDIDMVNKELSIAQWSLSSVSLEYDGVLVMIVFMFMDAMLGARMVDG
jgi:hypothetical protein